MEGNKAVFVAALDRCTHPLFADVFWIPEVSIGNPSLMEPVTDVEKVPRSRWKLNCYMP
jgi:hypothetical protein